MAIEQALVPDTGDVMYLCLLNFDGRDLRDCTLPQDIKWLLGEVPDFSEELPGEDIFPMFNPYVIVSF